MTEQSINEIIINTLSDSKYQTITKDSSNFYATEDVQGNTYNYIDSKATVLTPLINNVFSNVLLFNVLMDLKFMTFKNREWLRIFYHNIENGSNLFVNGNIYDDNNPYYCFHPKKYSILYFLPNLMLNGQYEFLLKYPESGLYNHWIQTSNPIYTSESVTGYQNIECQMTGHYWGGLALSSSGSTLIDGSINHGNWFFAIGSFSAWNNGIPGGQNEDVAVQQVELWVRIA